MNNKYYITIGLEIHAELKTNSKMFCACANNPLETQPNKNICPVCVAHPGTLPTFNKEAIEKMIKLGLYIGSETADFTEWDRKHYFYPDLPKAYQLTQYKYPIISQGEIQNWPLERIHLEEDTAKSTHDQSQNTLINFNRAGLPLAELVTKTQTFQEIETAAKTSSDFAKEYALILKILDVSEAEMSKGQMRIEVNLSVSTDKNKFGTKVEVKNINSFKSVEDAVRYEAARHIELIEAGKIQEIVQETRGFEENKRITLSQRKKENANDYKYFPDPDLPKLYLHSLFDLEKIKNNLPEGLAEIRNNLKKLSVTENYIEILLSDLHLFNYFQNIQNELQKYHDFNSQKFKQLILLAMNYICVDVITILQKENTEKFIHLIDAEDFVEIMTMLLENQLSSRGAKDLILIMMTKILDENAADMSEQDLSAREIAESRNLIQKNDLDSLQKILAEVIGQNPKQWEDFQNGNSKLLMFFVGQCMKASQGSGNPKIFTELIQESLKK